MSDKATKLRSAQEVGAGGMFIAGNAEASASALMNMDWKTVIASFPELGNLNTDLYKKEFDNANKKYEEEAAANAEAKRAAEVLAQSKAKAEAKQEEEGQFRKKFGLWQFLEQPGKPIEFDTYEEETVRTFNVELRQMQRGTLASGEKPDGYDTWSKEVLVSGVQFYSPAPARRCLRAPTLNAHNLCRMPSARRNRPLRRSSWKRMSRSTRSKWRLPYRR